MHTEVIVRVTHEDGYTISRTLSWSELFLCVLGFTWVITRVKHDLEHDLSRYVARMKEDR